MIRVSSYGVTESTPKQVVRYSFIPAAPFFFRCQKWGTEARQYENQPCPALGEEIKPVRELRIELVNEVANFGQLVKLSGIVVKPCNAYLHLLAELDHCLPPQELTKHAQRVADTASFDLFTTDNDREEIKIHQVGRTVVCHAIELRSSRAVFAPIVQSYVLVTASLTFSVRYRLSRLFNKCSNRMTIG